MKRPKLNRLLEAGFLCLLLSAVMSAQVKTETSKSQGQPTVDTKVERGEVVYVSGNDLVVKMEDGQIRNFPNVPDSAKITVDGQQLSVHDLKPGMKLERTITTTTTPQTVKTVKTVTGTVAQVMPPSSVTLTLEDGTRQQFKIPPGQKFTVDGKETDAFGLRKGMKVSATKIVTAPENVVSEQRNVTGEMPAPPPTEAMQGPVLIVVAPAQSAAASESKPTEGAESKPAETAQAQPTEARPKAKEELPHTATRLPLIGLFGTLVLLSGVVAAFWSRAH